MSSVLHNEHCNTISGRYLLTFPAYYKVAGVLYCQPLLGMKSVSVCTLLRVSETEQPAFNKHNVIFLVSFIDVGEFAAFFHQATHMGIIFTFLTEPYKIKTKQKNSLTHLLLLSGIFNSITALEKCESSGFHLIYFPSRKSDI